MSFILISISLNNLELSVVLKSTFPKLTIVKTETQTKTETKTETQTETKTETETETQTKTEGEVGIFA